MSQKPTPHQRFEVAVHEGYQFTEKGHTKIRLLLSFADASQQSVGWYMFSEGLVGPAAQAYDNILMNHKGKGSPRATRMIEFGRGAVDRASIQLKSARGADRMAGGMRGPNARIHDAKFVPTTNAKGQVSSIVARLELAMSFDLYTGTDREIVRANLSMLSTDRPVGNIYPAVGYLLLMGHERFSKPYFGPRETHSQTAQMPTA